MASKYCKKCGKKKSFYEQKYLAGFSDKEKHLENLCFNCLEEKVKNKKR